MIWESPRLILPWQPVVLLNWAIMGNTINKVLPNETEHQALCIPALYEKIWVYTSSNMKNHLPVKNPGFLSERWFLDYIPIQILIYCNLLYKITRKLNKSSRLKVIKRV